MGIAVGASTLQSDLDATQAAQPQLEKVNWMSTELVTQQSKGMWSWGAPPEVLSNSDLPSWDKIPAEPPNSTFLCFVVSQARWTSHLSTWILQLN
jgi:hypothetical protein